MPDPRMHENDTHEDIELGELENDAFLPREDSSKPIFKQQSVLTRWIPPRIRNFVEGISKVWIVFVVLLLFFFAVWFSSSMNASDAMAVTISPESRALTEELAKSLNHTSIPGYVLEYGKSLNEEEGPRRTTRLGDPIDSCTYSSCPDRQSSADLYPHWHPHLILRTSYDLTPRSGSLRAMLQQAHGQQAFLDTVLRISTYQSLH
ncbi:hypothetical protein DL98DRAFT_277260 [Cadophora sp. DSE1049]|nr:hypothetical protein DL98DRAFT_277260 [Cadophora sp. DSE1049]